MGNTKNDQPEGTEKRGADDEQSKDGIKGADLSHLAQMFLGPVTPPPTPEEIVALVDRALRDSQLITVVSERAAFLRGEEDGLRSLLEFIGPDDWFLRMRGEDQLGRLTKAREQAEKLSEYPTGLSRTADGIALPFREDLECKSRKGGRVIFDLYDLLNNEEKYRKRVWLNHTDMIRALAKRNVETKSPNISRSKAIAGELDKLETAIGRQLKWRAANGFPGDKDVLVGKTSKQTAGQLRDWLFAIGRSHQPKWLREIV